MKTIQVIANKNIIQKKWKLGITENAYNSQWLGKADGIWDQACSGGYNPEWRITRLRYPWDIQIYKYVCVYLYKLYTKYIFVCSCVCVYMRLSQKQKKNSNHQCCLEVSDGRPHDSSPTITVRSQALMEKIKRSRDHRAIQGQRA